MKRKQFIKSSCLSTSYQSHVSESSSWSHLTSMDNLTGMDGSTNMDGVISVDPSKYDYTIHNIRPGFEHFMFMLVNLMDDNNNRYRNLDIDGLTSAEFSDQQKCNCIFLWAAYFGKVHLMQRLYQERGADPSFTHPQANFNALHLLALYGSLDGIQWLLNKKCPIMNTCTGLSPLHFAAYSKNVDLCKYLMEQGCQVDSTVLHAAVHGGVLDCVAFILSSSSLPNEFDEAGLTALHIAIDQGNYSVVKLLLEDPRINVNLETKKHHYTALHMAAGKGYADSMRELLKKGAHVNVTSVHGQTPLYLCCKNAHIRCVELLLGQGSDINIQDHFKSSALHAAITESPRALDIVRILVEHEANIHLADKFGYTCLHLAASRGLNDCVEYLIMQGANVAARTIFNISALYFMIRKTPTSIKIILKRLDLAMSYWNGDLVLDFRDILHNSHIGETGFLRTLQKEGQHDILEHPLCQAFLYLKWQRVKWYIICRVILSIIAGLCLSFYILMPIRNKCFNATKFVDLKNICWSENFHCIECCDDSMESVCNETYSVSQQCINCLQNCNNSCCNLEYAPDFAQCSKFFLGSMIIKYPNIIYYMRSFIVMLVIVNCFRIFFCFAGYRPKFKYFKKYTNILEFVVSLSIIMIFAEVKPDEKLDLLMSIGACTVLCYWMYLTILIGYLPFFGTYIAMFKKVMREFMKMLVAYFCLLLGFMFTFCALDPHDFDWPVASFVSIFAMMTGELNLNDLLEKGNKHVVTWYMMLGVLWLFIMLVTIVLMNLLIGMAVQDIELRKRASLCKLIQQTKFIYFVELCCFQDYFPEWVIKLLRRFLYVWQNSDSGNLVVEPLAQNEKRLPRDIMDAAMEIAVRRTLSCYKKNVETQTVDKQLERFEAQFRELTEMVTTLSEYVHRLVVDSEGERNVNREPVDNENAVAN